MAKKSQIRSTVSVALDDAMLVALKPIIDSLDKYATTESGHELPSKGDLTLRITLNNLCRDMHQQIYGAPANGAFKGFPGIKNSWDQAQTAIARMVSNYANNPEDMEADPSFAKLARWEEQSQAKYETLCGVLNSFKAVYHAITGEEWKYVAPGSRTATPKLDTASAVARFKEISAQSVLIPKAVAA